jgi:hypothetical protein
MRSSPTEKAGLSNGDFVLRFLQAVQIKHIPEQVAEDVPVIMTVFQIDCAVVLEWSHQGAPGAVS